MAKIRQITKRTGMLVLAGVLALGLSGASLMGRLGSPAQVFADKYDDKIKEIQVQIDQNEARAAELRAQGDTLAGKLEQIRLETASLQNKIDLNEAQNAKFKSEITKAEARITENKKILAENIKKAYVDGNISSLEILASSKSLSDYIDKQEYRDIVRNKITDLTGEVVNLKKDLEQKQVKVANLIRDQIGLRVDLEKKQGETAKLIEDTRGQEDAYRNQVTAANAEVARLRSEQASANAAALAPKRGGISYVPSSGQANGGYPSVWDNAPQDSMVDSWGMYNRECVSYTAFKVYQSGRYMPYWGGNGNANLWPGNARRAGIPVDNNPRVGDVAIGMIGYYGHAMYVERVNDDGTVYVSQYNYGIRGEYSEMTISTAGLYFIHF
jgi:surface antigen